MYHPLVPVVTGWRSPLIGLSPIVDCAKPIMSSGGVLKLTKTGSGPLVANPGRTAFFRGYFRSGGDSTGMESRTRRRVVSLIAEGALPPRRHRVVCLLQTGVTKAHRLLPSLNPAAHCLGAGKAL